MNILTGNEIIFRKFFFHNVVGVYLAAEKCGCNSHLCDSIMSVIEKCDKKVKVKL